MEEHVGGRVITSKAENGEQLLKQQFFRKVVGKTKSDIEYEVSNIVLLQKR